MVCIQFWLENANNHITQRLMKCCWCSFEYICITEILGFSICSNRSTSHLLKYTSFLTSLNHFYLMLSHQSAAREKTCHSKVLLFGCSASFMLFYMFILIWNNSGRHWNRRGAAIINVYNLLIIFSCINSQNFFYGSFTNKYLHLRWIQWI